MNEEDLLYTLALQRTKGIGDINAKKLLSKYNSAKDIYKERKGILLKIRGISSAVIDELLNVAYLKEAENEIKYIKQNNVEVLFYKNENYPYNLKQCIDGPILLFKKGSFESNKRPIISIVGTRRVTSYGKMVCEKLISELKNFNPIIVSGFAYGVDIEAHKNAIKNNLKTIGVLAHGLDKLYPSAHSKYKEEVLTNGGFLTDFWHNDTIQRENFLKRNRIIAGISEATIIIESAEKGGSLVTADIANSYSREVFAVPGRSSDEFSKGCNNLIKQNKAALITSAQDIIQNLNWETSKSQKSTQTKFSFELEENEEIVFKMLQIKGKQQLDVIAVECNLPIQKASTTLFDLEMKGLVKPLPGKFYEAMLF